MILIKLGGSIITDKSTPYAFKGEIVARLANEIKAANENVVLVHGAGSYGHPLAKKYGLDKGLRDNTQLAGIAKVQRDVKNLNLRILNVLIGSGISSISLPPSSFALCENRKVKKMDITLVERYIELGQLPITFGDVVVDEKLGFCILSGDVLMLHLAKKLNPKRSIFVTDVNGVYLEGRLVKRVDEQTIKRVQPTKATVPDITGAILAKLHVGLQISKYSEVLLINGNVKGRLSGAILGKPVIGTRIG